MGMKMYISIWKCLCIFIVYSLICFLSQTNAQTNLSKSEKHSKISQHVQALKLASQTQKEKPQDFDPEKEYELEWTSNGREKPWII